MKIVLMLLVLLLTVSCSSVSVDGSSVSVSLILAILAGCYEVISRLIPTSKTWSIIGKLLEILTWLSNLFNRKK